MRPERFARTVASARAEGLGAHILPTSATMVGVCMTVISIVKLAHPGTIEFMIDRVLALDSVVFLSSAVLSFASIRHQATTVRLETWAELTFLLGLGMVAISALLLSFKIL